MPSAFLDDMQILSVFPLCIFGFLAAELDGFLPIGWASSVPAHDGAWFSMRGTNNGADFGASLVGLVFFVPLFGAGVGGRTGGPPRQLRSQDHFIQDVRNRALSDFASS